MAKGKAKYNKTKFYLVFAVVVAALAGIAHLWKLSPVKEKPLPDELAKVEVPDTLNTPIIPNNQNTQFTPEEEPIPEDTLTADSAPAPFFSCKVWSYPECFPDSNATQLIAAETNGIQPAESREDIMVYVDKRLLTDISTSPFYMIEDLTHSMPYLVPKAQLLLNTIGINFVDSLHSKGYPLHLPVVTSVLRTASDIQNLQQGNINSVTNSCHCYGTTIDITYNRFVPLEGMTLTCYDDNLKKVLAEVLYDLRAENRCYVKYERLQACFHLTVR
ncbi:MAG: hypothetical protein J5770_02085 [Bacteroidaceae bacterium]|nr:hypothetical protein [Bacteroidaceae bacterium]